MLKFEHIVVYIVSNYGDFLGDFDEIAKNPRTYYISDLSIVCDPTLTVKTVLDFALTDNHGGYISRNRVMVTGYMMTLLSDYQSKDLCDMSFVIDEDFMEVVHQYHNMNRL